MDNASFEKLRKLIFEIYETEGAAVIQSVESLIQKWKSKPKARAHKCLPDQSDIILITYGDAIKEENGKPLNTLHRFLTQYAKDIITGVHILPCFPYTSDDGFSVVDYYKINPELGDWDDIRRISGSFDLMLDAVVNHVSKSSEWFCGYLNCEDKYKDFFITADPSLDYSKVIRPRTLPLLTPFETREGTKYVWTTFSEDQIDLNFKNPDVLLTVLDVILTYAMNGARFIRLDAIGFLWKELGTSCMHLRQTHAIIKLMRLVLDEVFPGTIIITETNVPHKDNISYFGDGDEAHLVYQFPLPPLVMFSLQSGSTTKLTKWAKSLEEDTRLHGHNTYFNFLASHDGIGLRPTEGILDEDEKQFLMDTVIKNGGKISYMTKKDGTVSPYELNISYMDGITNSSEDKNERFNRFMAAQTIMLSLKGVPGIYYHSLLGSGNWIEGVNASGINRRINRQKLDYRKLTEALRDKNSLRSMVLSAHKRIIQIRGKHSAFSPFAEQKILDLSPALFAVERYNENTGEKIVAITNVTGKAVKLDTPIKGMDLLSGNGTSSVEVLLPYQSVWILV